VRGYDDLKWDLQVIQRSTGTVILSKAFTAGGRATFTMPSESRRIRKCACCVVAEGFDVYQFTRYCQSTRSRRLTVNVAEEGKTDSCQ